MVSIVDQGGDITYSVDAFVVDESRRECRGHGVALVLQREAILDAPARHHHQLPYRRHIYIHLDVRTV